MQSTKKKPPFYLRIRVTIFRPNHKFTFLSFYGGEKNPLSEQANPTLRASALDGLSGGFAIVQGKRVSMPTSAASYPPLTTLQERAPEGTRVAQKNSEDGPQGGDTKPTDDQKEEEKTHTKKVQIPTNIFGSFLDVLLFL